jgi:N-methylhydantoinase B
VTAHGSAALLRTEVTLGRLQAIADEAGSVLMRTAFSLGIREAKDFSCAVLTADGDTIVQSAQSIPMFIGTLAHTARRLLEAFPSESWQPGDVVASNDPWSGTGHLFDLTLLRPVFVDGVLTSFAAIVGHLSDIGGRGFSIESQDVYEEGFQIPPMKVVDGGRPDETFRRLLEANVRVSDQVLGDFDAMQGALVITERRLSSLADELSRDVLLGVYEDLDRRSESYMRAAIEKLPDGTYGASFTSEPILGSTYELQLALTVRGDTIESDFTGSSPQVDAAINSTLPYTRAYVVYALKCLLAAEVPFTGGLTRPIILIAPEGTVVNRAFPAPGVARNLVGQFVPTMIFAALAEVVPSLAEAGAPRPTFRVTGSDRSGRAFSAPFFVMGGLGARPGKDGIACIAFPTNTEVVPVEIIEATTPLLVESKELVTDSGGPGRFRGGLGQRIVVRCLTGRARAFVIAQRLHKPPEGSAGGESALPAMIFKNGRRIKHLTGPVDLYEGDTLTVQSAGGGGFGAPRNRARDQVDADVRAGYVSKRSAREQYGWNETAEERTP